LVRATNRWLLVEEFVFPVCQMQHRLIRRVHLMTRTRPISTARASKQTEHGGCRAGVPCRCAYVPDSVAVPLDARQRVTVGPTSQRDLHTRHQLLVGCWMSQFHRRRTVDPCHHHQHAQHNEFQLSATRQINAISIISLQGMHRVTVT